MDFIPSGSFDVPYSIFTFKKKKNRLYLILIQIILALHTYIILTFDAGVGLAVCSFELNMMSNLGQRCLPTSNKNDLDLYGLKSQDKNCCQL